MIKINCFNTNEFANKIVHLLNNKEEYEKYSKEAQI